MDEQAQINNDDDGQQPPGGHGIDRSRSPRKKRAGRNCMSTSARTCDLGLVMTTDEPVASGAPKASVRREPGFGKAARGLGSAALTA